MTNRIRWEEALDGEALGYVGSLDRPAFRIWTPEEDGGEWLLTAALPAMEGKRYYGTPDELKAEAEQWLERFVVSLGASFPPEDDAVFDERPTGPAMRALSIQHPWGAAIAYGTKRVENRTWTAPRWAIGQTIAIHASKKPDISARPPAGESWPEHRMHLGAVIAVAEVTDCHHATSCPRHEAGAPWPLCTPWSARGQFHWQIANVRPLADPVPCKGALGLWRLPEDVEKTVRAQLEASDGVPR